MKQVISTLIAGIVVAGMCMPSLAQPHGPGPRGGQGDGGEQRVEKLAELLDLSSEQTEQWRVLMDSHREAARARGEEMRMTRDRIRELASTENPNLEQLGQMTLDLHRNMEAMRGLREELDAERAAILTPEQNEKFELLREARDSFGDDKRADGKRGRGGRRGSR